MFLVLAAMIGVLPATLATTACTSAADIACDCAESTISIHVPADRAAAASKPVLSGACANDTLACNQQATAGGCTLWQFTPTQAGADCAIDVDFATGTTFHADLQIVQESGCCAGFYAQPTSAADVEVPEG
ncbi:MAG TPA: hypothetical protein VF407_16675 [Polyangiaceae bacterium]